MESQQPNSQTPVSNKNPIILGIVGAIAVLGAVIGFNMRDTDEQTNVTPTPTPTPGPTPVPTPTPVPVAVPTSTSSSPEPTTPTPTTSPSTYKDGTYTAQGDYTYHSGTESITITVTLKDDVITDTQFAGTPKASMSARFMSIFEKGYKEMVVGKDIDEVTLTKVSGSSRTPIGFNDAIAKIKAQAKM